VLGTISPFWCRSRMRVEVCEDRPMSMPGYSSPKFLVTCLHHHGHVVERVAALALLGGEAPNVGRLDRPGNRLTAGVPTSEANRESPSPHASIPAISLLARPFGVVVGVAHVVHVRWLSRGTGCQPGAAMQDVHAAMPITLQGESPPPGPVRGRVSRRVAPLRCHPPATSTPAIHQGLSSQAPHAHHEVPCGWPRCAWPSRRS
jgi:hypothetical protein